MTKVEDNRTLIEGFWDDLDRRISDPSRRLDPRGEYTDICTPDDDVARGGAEITARRPSHSGNWPASSTNGSTWWPATTRS